MTIIENFESFGVGNFAKNVTKIVDNYIDRDPLRI